MGRRGCITGGFGRTDSVALLRAMADWKQRAGGAGRLIVGHFNHRLRAEARRGCRVCGRFGREIAIELRAGQGRSSGIAKLRGDGVEAAARESRYEFLLRAAEKCGAPVPGDRAYRRRSGGDGAVQFSQGDGIGGVNGHSTSSGVERAVSLMRPMLGVRRADVLLYLQSIGQAYRTDATNLGTEFMRSRLRNELLPMLRENIRGC